MTSQANTQHQELEQLRARVAELEQVTRDITEKRQAQEGLEWALKVNAALSALYKSLIDPSATIKQIASTVLEQAQQLIGQTQGYVSTVDPGTGDLVSHTLTEMLPNQCQVAQEQQQVRFPHSSDGTYTGLWGYALNTKQAFYTNSPTTHPASTGLPEGHIPIERFLSVPVMLGEELVGQIVLMNSGRDFTDRDLETAQRLGEFYALAIQRKRIEDEREKLIEDLDAFGHTVAHDLKNPLGIVIGGLDMLKDDYDSLSRDDVIHYLEITLHSAYKMNTIIDSLLLLSGMRSKDVVNNPLDMQSVVLEALQHLTYAIDESEAEIILPDELPSARGYGPWVEQVWVNYLSNAIKYGGNPPVVEIGAEVQDGGMVQFWVRDNGKGIPTNAQGRVFTPFTRLEQKQVAGYGLGLSIAQRIVQKLGGNVGIHSEPGKGSTFTFTLPGDET